MVNEVLWVLRESKESSKQNNDLEGIGVSVTMRNRHS
ncbi:hypothetical protein ACVW0P_000924 [Mucilaginibacter sp. UYNi724]